MTLDKHYEASSVEQKLYANWESENCFEPEVSGDKNPYAIMMPPPNVTGTLHVGHALDNTLPDMLVRRARMKGFDALYQPGTDHASIAVHVVLDRQFKDEGTNRFEMGREKFLERAWAWKDHSHSTIASQMRRLGVSCAWHRERFTMDEGLSKAVEHIFIELHKRDLIYRGQRLVNWDPNMQTSVSDLEVKHKEVNGHLWHFTYPFADGGEYNGEKGINIATTRPETILADGAIAINPKDPRAGDLVGRMVTVPIVNREIPIIADDYVDPDFGSGMVKITAAHDFNDFEVYKRHKDSVYIPLINLMTPEAKMNENCPEGYVGMDRFDARNKVIEDFKELGLFVKEEEHMHGVPHAERDDTILEPYLSNQWFVKGEPLAKKCLQAADDGEVNFVNPRDEKVYRHWLNNIQDWCISRQLWWGHRIPAWYKGEEIKVQAECPGAGWEQDNDVLDTWFSSALWPMSTLGWPEKTPEFNKFFPQEAIMPGRDILFFWIIRMMMMAKEFTGKSPFKTIYTHAMILDEKGQKMSKSKGNVMNPLDLMDKFGTDAMRYTLVNQSAIGQDIKLGEHMVEQGRNFCTKIWNASRFAEMNGIQLGNEAEGFAQAKHPVNLWMCSVLKETIGEIEEAFDGYRFNDVGGKLYHLMWSTFCDWYLELIKPLVNGDDEALKAETKAVAGAVLTSILKVLHPMMPYITEKLWQDMDGATEGYLMQAAWPKVDEIPSDETSKTDINWLVNVVGAIRTARSEMKVAPKVDVTARVKGAEGAAEARFEKFASMIAFLTKTSGFESTTEAAAKTEVVAVAEGLEILLNMDGIVDFAAEKERLEKEIEKAEKELSKIEGMLGNESFVARAPEHVVTEQQTKRDALMADLKSLKSTIEARF